MKHPLKARTSMRTQTILLVLFCWILPILILLLSEVSLLDSHFVRAQRNELELAGSHALGQTLERFETAVEESKAVSYDGTVRSAYRTYQLKGDSAALYRTVTTYLNQRFSHSQPVRAMFIRFWSVPDIHPYISRQPEDRSRTVWSQYQEVEPELLAAMQDADTRIVLMERDGRLYLARNLLDSRLLPYATVVLLCENSYLAQPLESVRFIGTAACTVDGLFSFREDGVLTPVLAEDPESLTFAGELAGHSFTLDAQLRQFSMLEEMPELKVAFLISLGLILLLLVVLLLVFSRQVSRPVQTLVQATTRIQNGERGYTIGEQAGSREFQTLYQHFNSMSTEMKKQFEDALLEQKALQQAQIKALQSQINPHFLNNTLEIINWEARIAGNDRISAMIEALATMLDAALDRNGSARIPLREELKYVDAYLYITRERMGERLTTCFEIADDLQEQLLPRLILQPMVENAVEHDISHGGAGQVTIRAFREGGSVVLEVVHSGRMTEADRENIARLLADSPDAQTSGGRIGIRNVNQRLKLLYGEAAGLTIDENEPGTICARIVFPAS